tara:strand:+ start:473 stop:727 length:255 start_codon:yes stop_codon:yes gene_type:complete
MGFLKSFEEFGENLVELGLILGRPKVTWVLSGDDDNVGKAISILVTEVLTDDTAETIPVHGPANLLFGSHKANAMTNSMLSVFR